MANDPPIFPNAPGLEEALGLGYRKDHPEPPGPEYRWFSICSRYHPNDDEGFGGGYDPDCAACQAGTWEIPCTCKSVWDDDTRPTRQLGRIHNPECVKHGGDDDASETFRSIDWSRG